MNYARNRINAARLAAALMLTGMAGSGAQAQSSNAAPAAALAPGLAVAAGASAHQPFPHGPHPFGGPSLAPASALDGSEVDKQNGGDKIDPNRFRDDRGPAADTPFQAPDPVTLATKARTPGAATAATFTATDWPTYGMNRQRTGYNPVETVLNATNVTTLTEQHNGPIPKVSPVLDGAILTQPVLATGVMIGNVPTDIVYVATEGNTTYALNAADVSQIIWKSAAIPQATLQNCTGLFQGKIGVQGTPVIDHANNRLFVVSGKGYLHAYNMATGADLPGFNLALLDAANVSPITMVYGGLTLSPDGSSIYVATAGDPCDDQPYHGQVVRASTTNPAAILQRWFPTGASGPNGGGIWGFGGVSIPPDGTVVYALTGNAFATPENAGFAEHVVKLTPTLAVAASNSPLQPAPNADIDFGATAMLFQRPNCPTMLAAYNKSGILFIYNRATIQQAGPIQRLTISQDSAEGNNIGLPVFDPVLNQLYVVSPSGAGIYKRGLIALSIDSNCSVNPTPVWQAVVPPQSPPGTFNPAIPPVAANGVVYYADGLGNDVYAFDAAKGGPALRTPLFTRHYTPVQTGEGNFAPPAVVNGQVYVAGSDHRVHAYSLP